MNFKQKTDPYQWFFPLGILLGIQGVGSWVFFKAGLLSYPAVPHAETMIGGFLFIIALGFLMTAIPRFTGTHSARIWEKGIAFLPALFLPITFFLSDRIYFHAVIILEIALLLRFGMTRLLKATHAPVPPFVLVAFGLLYLLASSMAAVHHRFFPLEPETLQFFRLLSLHGTFVALGLGVGTQLIPNITGLRTATQQPTPLSVHPTNRMGIRMLFACYGIILTLSFVMEAWVSIGAGRLLRAILATTVVLGHWHLLQFPKGVSAIVLWLSGWMLFLGTWPGVLWPSYAVHGSHVLFIGSLTMMIVGVATRVTLAHGGHGLEEEKRSPYLAGAACLLMLALTLRLAAPFTGDSYFTVLAWASLAWISALTLWACRFFPKLIFRNHGTE